MRETGCRTNNTIAYILGNRFVYEWGNNKNSDEKRLLNVELYVDVMVNIWFHRLNDKWSRFTVWHIYVMIHLYVNMNAFVIILHN